MDNAVTVLPELPEEIKEGVLGIVFRVSMAARLSLSSGKEFDVQKDGLMKNAVNEHSVLMKLAGSKNIAVGLVETAIDKGIEGEIAQEKDEKFRSALRSEVGAIRSLLFPAPQAA